MVKWEYTYAIGDRKRILKINGEAVGKTGALSDKSPRVVEFLSKMGRDGWEVAGICTDAQGYLLIVLKRPLSP